MEAHRGHEGHLGVRCPPLMQDMQIQSQTELFIILHQTNFIGNNNTKRQQRKYGGPLSLLSCHVVFVPQLLLDFTSHPRPALWLTRRTGASEVLKVLVTVSLIVPVICTRISLLVRLVRLRPQVTQRRIVAGAKKSARTAARAPTVPVTIPAMSPPSGCEFLPVSASAEGEVVAAGNDEPDVAMNAPPGVTDLDDVGIGLPLGVGPVG